MYLFDAGGLIFTQTPVPGGGTYSVHASGTYAWDPVSNTGTWDISVPFDPNATGVDLGGWFNGFNGTVATITNYSSTTWDTTYPTNNGTINGDIALQFASPLGLSTDVTTGSFQVQNDFWPYSYTGTISGSLVPVAVPLPSAFVLLLIGVVVLGAFGMLKRQTYSLAF